ALTLVAHGASRTFNPTLSQSVVDRALEKDRPRATAEYLAEFRTDVEGFVALEVVEACVGDYREQQPAADNVYEAFTDPSQVGGDFAALLKSYRVASVSGDRYAGEFPRELFRKYGISYELATLTKSELFRDLLPLLNSVRVTLPRNERLVAQIVGLERRVSAAGRDIITHPPHGHDDLANAVAGAASLSQYPGFDVTGSWISGPERPPEDPRKREER